ncbi:hypothetical protein C8Q77DRAFT_1216385 [Trametes polyzona]|nr:hypothetical protein C8Q77DRAFT_1216385 [Trametes polyzona]
MPRHSLEVFDRLLERAFAPRDLAILSPSAPVPVLSGERAPSPETPLDMPDEDLAEVSPAQQDSIDTVWEDILSAKEKGLAGSPSKVKSLEGVVLPPVPLKKVKVAKRRSGVTFTESPDGKNMVVTFDMAGVKKQDMHVSYRTTRLIVSWRVERTMERREGDTLVRDREVRKYNHTIPLAEGTKFEEVRASRDGQKLMLTIPNTKCVRADSDAPDKSQNPASEGAAASRVRALADLAEEDELDEEEEEPTNMRTIPDFETALSGVSEYHSCALAPTGINA